MKNRLPSLLFLIYIISTHSIIAQFAEPILLQEDTSNITNIVFADINNDNLKDIIVTKKIESTSISYFINLGDLNFSEENVILSGNSLVTNIATGDFNNDGWEDLISIGDNENSVRLHINSNSTFTSQVIDTFTFFESDISASDIDNDGDLDFIAIGGPTFKVFYNDGSANFTQQTISGPQDNFEDFFDITIADIDNDGYEDVITGGANTSVYKNTNGIITYDSTRSSAINNGTNLMVKLVDLDNDGDLDLLSQSNSSSFGIHWIENDGNGNFINTHIIDPNPYSVESVTVKDFDNDEDNDILISDNFDLLIYNNDSLGNFSLPSVIQDNDLSISTVYSEDFDNDGDYDIIWSADLSIQLNNNTLSIDKNPDNNNINIYPNPVLDNINIYTETSGKCTVYNFIGQIIASDISLNSGYNTIKLSNKAQGYIIKIETNNKATYKKVLSK